MGKDFEKLVLALSTFPLSVDIICHLTSLIKQQDVESLASFVSQSFQSLLILEQWSWQLLSEDSLQWIEEPYYLELLHALATFNKTLIFNADPIDIDSKGSLLFPESINQLNGIFKHIEQIDDENNPYITIINRWFDNHSYFAHENLQYNTLAIIRHIGEYFVRHYVMSNQFKLYLRQLQQPEMSQSKISAKMLFYIKTCSFFLYVYLSVNYHNFYYSREALVSCLGDGYLRIIDTHAPMVARWSKEFLGCMAHLISFLSQCCWWGGKTPILTKILLPTEQITCEHLQNLMYIVAHTPLYEDIKSERSNDETALFEALLFFIVNVLETQNVSWLFRSNPAYQKILLTVAEITVNDVICVTSYDILSIVLPEEQMKELKMNDRAATFSINILQKTWYHSSKSYEQIPIIHILQAVRNLSKNDSMQQKIADLNQIPLFIAISDEYPIAYDIIWTLSFNRDIQQQLRANSLFMSKLPNLAKDCGNTTMRKVIDGILWNLEIHSQDRPITPINDEETFDIMISYSHKNKELCKQLYEELIKANYRVWIDFDRLHGKGD